MNNDDICIHCELTKEEHEQNTPWCHDFKSISQHYAEQRGPENLELLYECDDMLSEIEDYEHGDRGNRITTLRRKIIKAIEASKPPKE